eukprot:COSAG01_NODE_9807_length_2339_cov_1.695089_3_plen_123_part_00
MLLKAILGSGRGRYGHGEVTMFPPHTAGFAIFAFLRSPGDFWEAIFACIQVGGDTDTVAACCGAIAGAYNGFSQITAQRPDDAGYVLAAIHDSDQPGSADVAALRKLAAGVHRVATSPAHRL